MTEEGNGVVTHPEIEEDSCKGCGRCVAACPRKCLALKATMNRMGIKPVEYMGKGGSIIPSAEDIAERIMQMRRA